MIGYPGAAGGTVTSSDAPVLTLQEAADALGVHYMTAYRYVRLGLLQASKTGGTWKVARVDLEEFTSPATPAGGTGPRRRRAPWAARLEQRLLAGDPRGAWGVVEAALAAGAEHDEIYLDVLSPALVSIGDRWERGEIDIADEHRASGIAMRIVGRLGPRFVRRGRTRGVVIVGAPAGEHHNLPVALVADLVRQGGWEVSDLGADTPTASFAHAALSTDGLVAVGISVTTPEALPSASEALAALREVTTPQVVLFLGGLAVRDREHARELGADDFAGDGRALAELLDRLADVEQ
jgi:MerR family transcriptional regulator, light-induced transcriptional regulator